MSIYQADVKKLSQTLMELDKKAQQFEETIKDIRVAVHDLLWKLIELKEDKKNNKKNLL